MKSKGNVKSNAHYNPDEVKHPPPTNMIDSERDSDLEKYIRCKSADALSCCPIADSMQPSMSISHSCPSRPRLPPSSARLGPVRADYRPRRLLPARRRSLRRLRQSPPQTEALRPLPFLRLHPPPPPPLSAISPRHSPNSALSRSPSPHRSRRHPNPTHPSNPSRRSSHSPASSPKHPPTRCGTTSRNSRRPR